MIYATLWQVSEVIIALHSEFKLCDAQWIHLKSELAQPCPPTTGAKQYSVCGYGKH